MKYDRYERDARALRPARPTVFRSARDLADARFAAVVQRANTIESSPVSADPTPGHDQEHPGA